MALKGCGDLEVRHTYNWETEMKQMKDRNGTDRTDQAMKFPYWELLFFSRSWGPRCASYHVGGRAMTNLLEIHL
jgi:hypothetical protein